MKKENTDLEYVTSGSHRFFSAIRNQLNPKAEFKKEEKVVGEMEKKCSDKANVTECFAFA